MRAIARTLIRIRTGISGDTGKGTERAYGGNFVAPKARNEV
jgi:hypothetical protein